MDTEFPDEATRSRRLELHGKLVEALASRILAQTSVQAATELSKPSSDEALETAAFFARIGGSYEEDVYNEEAGATDAISRGEPAPLSLIEQRANRYAHHWSHEIISSWLNCLVAIGFDRGGYVRAAELNEAGLPFLTVDTLVTYIKTMAVPIRLHELGPLPDLGIYDGWQRRELAGMLGSPPTLPVEAINYLATFGISFITP